MTSSLSRPPLRVAFIGTGQMARQHLNAIARIATPAVVVGVYDRAPERAQEFATLASRINAASARNQRVRNGVWTPAGVDAYASVPALLDGARPDVVHVCTPPSAHFDAAYAALDRGAHVYVEKPFATTTAEATRLLDLAASRGTLVCAGHQLLRDAAFEELMAGAAGLGTIVQVDSHFAFRPVGPPAARTGARALANQAFDILPHPLYTLVDALERFAPAGGSVDIQWAQGGPTDLQAVLRAGEIVGRLSVSLRARPVASTLTVIGTRGSLACDFVRSIVVGAGNDGTAALEKILNPMLEGAQLIGRTARSLGRRLRTGGSYPGLAELMDAFYRAVLHGGEPPLSPAHLLHVTSLFENLVARVEAPANTPSVLSVAPKSRRVGAPLVVLTGARGFLGSRIASALENVRGLGRATSIDDRHVQEWVTADLSVGVPDRALESASVVVHAAAETCGGYDAHQRNTLDATRHLLRAMHAQGVSRLVLVSSLSVLRPPRTSWEQQDESTPRPSEPRQFGAYAWGKTRQEQLVEEAAALGIATKIVRPGALMDWNNPELPGLVGRHLFGRWHLGLGRPGLPIAVCDVAQCAEAIAWCATHFDDAPEVVNLLDPELRTRGAVIERLKVAGWTGRVIWVPISAICLGIVTARTLMALAHGRLPDKLAAWSILRPRRYDTRLAARVLDAAAYERRTGDATTSVPMGIVA